MTTPQPPPANDAPERRRRGRPPKEGRDTDRMTSETAQIYSRIEARAAELKQSLPALLSQSGMNESLFRNWERTTKEPSLATMRKIALALGLNPGWMAFGVGPRTLADMTGASQPGGASVPVYGSASGSILAESTLSPDPIEYVLCPPALRTVRDIYAVYVQGESMVPEHRPGDLRFVHPHKPPAPGDSILIQERTVGTNSARVFIKVFRGLSGDYLVTQQHNPALEVKFLKSGIICVHKVMRTSELVS